MARHDQENHLYPEHHRSRGPSWSVARSPAVRRGARWSATAGSYGSARSWRSRGRWEEIGRAHAETFATIRPASSMVEVTRLIAPDLLVEIEATAVVTPYR
jgi:hypothetical protein